MDLHTWMLFDAPPRVLAVRLRAHADPAAFIADLEAGFSESLRAGFRASVGRWFAVEAEPPAPSEEVAPADRWLSAATRDDAREIRVLIEDSSRAYVQSPPEVRGRLLEFERAAQQAVTAAGGRRRVAWLSTWHAADWDRLSAPERGEIVETFQRVVTYSPKAGWCRLAPESASLSSQHWAGTEAASPAGGQEADVAPDWVAALIEALRVGAGVTTVDDARTGGGDDAVAAAWSAGDRAPVPGGALLRLSLVGASPRRVRAVDDALSARAECVSWGPRDHRFVALKSALAEADDRAINAMIEVVAGVLALPVVDDWRAAIGAAYSDFYQSRFDQGALGRFASTLGLVPFALAQRWVRGLSAEQRPLAALDVAYVYLQRGVEADDHQPSADRLSEGLRGEVGGRVKRAKYGSSTEGRSFGQVGAAPSGPSAFGRMVGKMRRFLHLDPPPERSIDKILWDVLTEIAGSVEAAPTSDRIDALIAPLPREERAALRAALAKLS